MDRIQVASRWLTHDKKQDVGEADREELLQVIDQRDVIVLQRISFDTEQTRSDIIECVLTIGPRFGQSKEIDVSEE